MEKPTNKRARRRFEELSRTRRIRRAANLGEGDRGQHPKRVLDDPEAQHRMRMAAPKSCSAPRGIGLNQR